jgi:hypothetical protein
MLYPNVLAINLEGQVANFCINIQYPSHVDKIMLAFKQRFERLEATNSKLGGLITIHVV